MDWYADLIEIVTIVLLYIVVCMVGIGLINRIYKRDRSR